MALSHSAVVMGPKHFFLQTRTLTVITLDVHLLQEKSYCSEENYVAASFSVFKYTIKTYFVLEVADDLLILCHEVMFNVLHVY